MADNPSPTILVQVGRSPSSRRRTFNVSGWMLADMETVHEATGDVTLLLRQRGYLEDDEFVLQWGPLRDGRHVNVPSPAPGAFALAEEPDALTQAARQERHLTLQALERRVAVLEAQRGTTARDKLLASQLRNLADHGNVQSLADRNHLRAIATALDGGRRRPRA